MPIAPKGGRSNELSVTTAPRGSLGRTMNASSPLLPASGMGIRSDRRQA